MYFRVECGGIEIQSGPENISDQENSDIGSNSTISYSSSDRFEAQISYINDAPEYLK